MPLLIDQCRQADAEFDEYLGLGSGDGGVRGGDDGEAMTATRRDLRTAPV